MQNAECRMRFNQVGVRTLSLGRGQGEGNSVARNCSDGCRLSLLNATSELADPVVVLPLTPALSPREREIGEAEHY
jgi:hypothetical protein